MEKIRNETISATKVGEISKKVQERRLRWYGPVLRRRGVRGKTNDGAASGRWGRGRPKWRWMDDIDGDLRQDRRTAS